MRFAARMLARRPERFTSNRVSVGYFDVLGVHAAYGRTLRAEDDVPNTPRVVVLGNALWRNRYGGDTAIVGRTVTLNDLPYLVLGVMPAGFEDVLRPDAQLWTPLRNDVRMPYACRDCRHLRVTGRLKAGDREARPWPHRTRRRDWNCCGTHVEPRDRQPAIRCVASGSGNVRRGDGRSRRGRAWRVSRSSDSSSPRRPDGDASDRVSGE